MALYTDSGVTLYETTPRKVTFQETYNLQPGSIGADVYIDGARVTGSGASMALQSGSIILAEFSLVSSKGDPHDHALDPEGYFLDEAYRLIYGWKDKDFTNMPTSDVAEMTRVITEKVNQRIGKEVVKEALVTNFGFIPRDELQH